MLAAPRPFPNHDSWTWAGSTSGVFQVRDLPISLDGVWCSRSSIPTSQCKLVLKKINLLYLVCEEVLSTMPVAISHEGISVSSLTCPLCTDLTEDVNHALFKCVFACRVWDGLARWWEVDPLVFCDCDDMFSEEILHRVLPFSRRGWAAIILVAAWQISRARN